jgi:drug/metabolite transporter (DMT)-like permease
VADRGIQERPSRLKLALAFAAVYITWGATYLAIRYAIETLPPLLMAGTRFILAGGALYIWARLRGVARSEPINWRAAAIIGGLLLLGGNGAVVLAERSVPSGLAALLVATEPLMIVLLDWARPGGARPSGRVSLGLILGLVGMIVLIGPVGIGGSSEMSFAGAALLIAATFSWAAGSLYAARTKVASSPLMAAAMQMLAGGVLLLLAGLVTGEVSKLDISQMSLRSISALIYLVLFGSLVGFTSYSWLLRVTPPSLASTYAYVNPVVAVLLGWAIASEPLTLRTMLAATIIIAAVVIITSYRGHNGPQGEKALAETEGEERMTDSFAPGFAKRECAEAGD